MVKKRKIPGIEDVPDEEEVVEFVTANKQWKETIPSNLTNVITNEQPQNKSIIYDN